MTSNRVLTAWLLIAALVVVASPAAAQYMYLDSNGNGVHDSGDRLAPNGSPTTVDVWLITDHNRDGTGVICDIDGISPLMINSYVFNLLASNGLVSYSGFINQMATFNVSLGQFDPGDGLRYKNGWGGQVPLPPGLYRLATMTITGLSGSPHVDLVDLNSGVADFTSFGTGAGGCFGNDFDNTYKLAGAAGGTDWTDVDGLDIATIDEGTPVIDSIGNKTVSEGSCLTFTATATPAHGGALTFTLDPGAPTGASITAGGQFTWCPTEAQGPGLYTVTLRVTEDGTPSASDAETFQVTAAEVDQAPVLAAISNQVIMAGNTLSFTATATDADLPANTLFFSLAPGAPAGATITAGGSFSWPVPVNQVAGVTITVRVSDGFLSDAKSFAVTVLINEEGPPVVNNPGNMSVNEGSCLNFTALATSAGGGPLTFSLGAGAPAGASIAPEGQFNWCPTEAQGPGSYPITINCTEGALTGSTTFTATVREVNLAPVLAPIGNKVGGLGNLITFTATASDADLPSNALTFSLDPGAPPGATIHPTSGVFSWTVNLCGSVPVTIRVSDNGSLPLSDAETILISSECPFPPPVLNAIGDKTADEGINLTFTATAAAAQGGAVTFSLAPGNPPGSIINPSSGLFQWLPAESQGGQVWQATICATEVATGLMDCETINITVLENNIAPVLSPIGNKIGIVGVPITFTAVATDADIPANALSFFLQPGAPRLATIDPTTGAFSWTTSTPGTYPIVVWVTDNGSPPLYDYEAISISVGQPQLTLQQPEDMVVGEGNTASQQISAFSPDGGAITFSKVSGPPWMTVTTIDPTIGRITLAPDFAAAGSYVATVRASAGSSVDEKSFSIVVTNVCRRPTADAGGPYSGLVGIPVGFSGIASSDPDGGALTYSWDFGDGTTGTGVTPRHTYTAPGGYSVVLAVTNSCGLFDDAVATAFMTNRCADALAFTQGGNNKISLGSGKPQACIQLQPVNGSFSIEDVDLRTIVMDYMGHKIGAISTKTVIGADKNGDGIDEVSVCFSKADLRWLFSSVQGTQVVNVGIEGAFAGGLICLTNLDLTIKAGSGGNLAANISPNPLNPSAILTFATQERGPIRVQLFDVRGRLVRTLRDESDAAAGYHDVRIDGTDASGTKLSSGVYFVRIRAGADEERKAITILK